MNNHEEHKRHEGKEKSQEESGAICEFCECECDCDECNCDCECNCGCDQEDWQDEEEE